jgi:competence protein ComGC
VVKKHLKNEEGFTLVQTLATFILITLLGMGLIMLAFKVSEQITVTQAISHTKNDKTYVTQEAKLTLDSELEKLFSGENLAENPLGTNTNTLDRLMKNFVNEHKVINEGTIGKKKDITYQNKLLNYKIEPGELVSPGDEDEQGWVNGKPSGVVGIEYRAYKVTMPIESFVMKFSGNQKMMEL